MRPRRREDPAQGWWEDMIGPGRPIDTRRFFVICINSLGSPFGSTSPISINPRDGQPYRLTFPGADGRGHGARRARSRCRARHQEARRRGRSVARRHDRARVLRAVPGRDAQRRVSISAAARSVPFSIALRSLQREMIRRDPAWQDGNYTADAMPVQGMRLARKLGMITYRSAKEWALRFGRERASAERKPGDPFGIDFEVESYLENHATKFTGQFDPNCYLYISRAMDLFDLADHGGVGAGGAAALRRRARADHRRRDGLAVPDRPAAGTRGRPGWPAAATFSSCACRRCRGTTRSWSTWTGSVRSSADFLQQKAESPARRLVARPLRQEQRRVHHRAIQRHAPVQMRPGHATRSRRRRRANRPPRAGRRPSL